MAATYSKIRNALDSLLKLHIKLSPEDHQAVSHLLDAFSSLDRSFHKIEALENAKVDVLGYLGHQPKDYSLILNDLKGKDSNVTRRLREECIRLGFKLWRFVRVSSDYYSWSLEQRQSVLGAPGIQYLCKSVIMQNTRCTEDNCLDRSNSKYYLIVIQYVAKLHKESMAKVIQSLSNSTLGKKNFNFRLAPEDVSDQLSGFEHNAVTPIGMKIQIPIILDKPIADLEFIWLGGGEVDVKWGIPIPEFIRIFNPIIAEVSK